MASPPPTRPAGRTAERPAGPVKPGTPGHDPASAVPPGMAEAEPAARPSSDRQQTEKAGAKPAGRGARPPE